MKKSIIALLIVSGLIAAGTGIWFATKPKTGGMEGRQQGGSPNKPVQVRTATVTAEATPLVLEAVGTVEAEKSVEIRAEVGGILQKINFREGDPVKAGQVLFQIDADTQQAEVEKARANLERDQATLNEAQAQARRLQSLAAKEYVTQQEYAQAVAQEQAAQATVRADQATLHSAQLQHAHTRITAPISGRAGILNIKQGNLVSAASATPLVVINATRPVMVSFSVPQQQLAEIRAQQRKRPLAVVVRRNAQDAVLDQGVLAFIDNAVDTQTGTLRMKARIPNKDEAIWPGELVTLSLVLSVQQDALVIPDAALQAGQNGSFVYAVVDGKAQVQAVKVTRQIAGKVIVGEGLSKGQQVIVNPPKNLRPDSPVEAAEQSAATNGTAPRMKGNGRRNKAGGERP